MSDVNPEITEQVNLRFRLSQLRPRRDAEIVRLYVEEQLSPRVIGNRVGLTRMHIYNVLDKQGVERRRQNRREPVDTVTYNASEDIEVPGDHADPTSNPKVHGLFVWDPTLANLRSLDGTGSPGDWREVTIHELEEAGLFVRANGTT